MLKKKRLKFFCKDGIDTMMPKLRQPLQCQAIQPQDHRGGGGSVDADGSGGGEKSAAEVEVALGDDRLLPARREGLPLGVREGSSVL